MDNYLNIDEELVDYAEVSGFDFETGSYIKNVNLLDSKTIVEKSTFDFMDMIKSVFNKKESIV